jgi:nucleoside 2-deoxyribosyltransferase
MGAAVDWQQQIINDPVIYSLPVTILNPRRKDWDSTWPQDPNFKPFREQVEWELAGLDAADIVFFYFDPKTKAPISLMELGLMLGKGKKVIVCCPKEFWRCANVEITCQSEFVLTYDKLDSAIMRLETLIYDFL